MDNPGDASIFKENKMIEWKVFVIFSDIEM